MKVYYNGTIAIETEGTLSTEQATSIIPQVKDMLKSEYPNIDEASAQVNNGDIYFTVTPKTKGC